MTISRVEAWSFDGKTYPTEGQAIHAAVAKTLANPAIAQKVIDHSSDLIPLLQRVVEIEAEKRKSAPQPHSDTHGLPAKREWQHEPATTDRDPATGLLPGQMTGAL